MMYNKYQKHAIDNLLEKRENDIKQKGKSDIEPKTHVNNVIEWYAGLINIIECNVPKYFIRTLLIDQDEKRRIVNIQYDYYDFGEKIEGLSIEITLI